MAIHFPTKIVFGTPDEIKPIVWPEGSPKGKARLRFRNTDAALVFVRHANSIFRYHLEDLKTHWRPLVNGATHRMDTSK